jgi:hypothetical protein
MLSGMNFRPTANTCFRSAAWPRIQWIAGRYQGEQLEILVDGELVKLYDWDREITGQSAAVRVHPFRSRLACTQLV